MKNILIIILLTNLLTGTNCYAKTQAINGYYKSNGTYVKPYYRTTPDAYKFNNYSYRYNYNPATNKRGTVKPYSTKIKLPSPKYKF